MDRAVTPKKAVNKTSECCRICKCHFDMKYETGRSGRISFLAACRLALLADSVATTMVISVGKNCAPFPQFNVVSKIVIDQFNLPVQHWIGAWGNFPRQNVQRCRFCVWHMSCHNWRVCLLRIFLITSMKFWLTVAKFRSVSSVNWQNPGRKQFSTILGDGTSVNKLYTL